MSMQRIGRCSICGGDVMAWHGVWMATIPPPPAKCASCGAIPAGADDTIEMVPYRGTGMYRVTWTSKPESEVAG